MAKDLLHDRCVESPEAEVLRSTTDDQVIVKRKDGGCRLAGHVREFANGLQTKGWFRGCRDEE